MISNGNTGINKQLKDPHRFTPTSKKNTHCHIYLQRYDTEFYKKITSFSDEYNKKILSELVSRMKKFAEYKELTQYFYGEYSLPDKALIINKKMKLATLDDVYISLQLVLHILEWQQADFENIEDMKNLFIEKIQASWMKNGQVLWPTRCALSGEKFSPWAFEMIYILWNKESIARISQCLKELG